MKNRNYKRIAVIVVVIIAVFGLGLITGLELGFRKFREPLASMRTLLILSAQGQIAALQYQNTDYKEGKESLVKFINLMDELKAKGEITDIDQKSYYVDRGLSFARLALLEEKAGNKSETAKNIQEARKMFQMAGWKDYSEDRTRFFVNRIDKKWESKDGKVEKR
jgi:hypothetical protein